MARKLNKAGDFRGGENSPGSFTSDNEQQKKAQANSQTGEAKDKASATRAIATSPVVMNNGKKKRITPEVQQYIRDELTKTDRSGKTFLLSFIQNFLKEAKADPNSKAGMMLANSMFNDKLFTTLDESLLSEDKQSTDIKLYTIRQTLYEQQKQVYDDNYNCNFLVVCSRRVGKTELAARLIVRDLIKPIKLSNGVEIKNNVAYMVRRFSDIHNIDDALQKAMAAADLKVVHRDYNGQLLTFDNGSNLLLVGNNNVGDINKLRGFHFNTLIMDECGHQRNVRLLMTETVEPTLADYGREAKLYLIGTPPRIPGTFIEEIHNHAKERGWKEYHWTFEDNPFLPDKDTLIERVCQKYGVDKGDPFIRREYYGELGVFDTDAMVFRGYQTHKVLTREQMETEVWDRMYIGVDWGYEDKAAIVVALVKGKNMIVVYDWAKSRCMASETMEKVKSVYDQFKTLKVKKSPMVICDNNAKDHVYELAKKYKLPAYCAYKAGKDMAIDLLAGWLRTGTIKIPDNAELNIYQEAEKTLWQRDPETDKIIHEIDDGYFHPNSMFALLYVSRQFDNDVLMSGNSKTAKNILEDAPKDKGYWEEEGYDYEVI